MSVIRIAGRYAKSLIELAQEKGELEEVLSDIQGFKDAMANRDLQLLVKSPIVSADKKLGVFQALFGGKVSELTSAFFDIIIRKGREQYLPEIATEFISQYKLLQGITSAELTTASAVTDAQMEEIKKQMIHIGAAGENVELSTKVDQDIIGGFILEIGDRLYDASIRTKLAEMKKSLIDNTYIKSL
ncbi:MAG: ATP synthase F1 subunit delta [Bacteroidota bacterium]